MPRLPGAWLLASFSFSSARGLEFLGQVLANAAQLAAQQTGAPGHDNGPGPAKDLFGGPINPGPAELFGQAAEPPQGDGQQVGMLAGDQRADDMVGRAGQATEIVLGIVPLVED